MKKKLFLLLIVGAAFNVCSAQRYVSQPLNEDVINPKITDEQKRIEAEKKASQERKWQQQNEEANRKVQENNAAYERAHTPPTAIIIPDVTAERQRDAAEEKRREAAKNK